METQDLLIRSFYCNPLIPGIKREHREVMAVYKKKKFSIKDLFSKWDQIRKKLRIWSHLLEKSIIGNFIFCAMLVKGNLAEVFKLPIAVFIFKIFDPDIPFTWTTYRDKKIVKMIVIWNHVLQIIYLKCTIKQHEQITLI